MRWIDSIIDAVNNHPYISETHKRILVARIDREPTKDELKEYSAMTSFKAYQDGGLGSQAFGHTQEVSEPPVFRQELSFIDRARHLVYEYVKNRLEKTDTHVTFSSDEVYGVWFSKTLKNWKALVSTTLPDGMYYEVTYNGVDRETYLDAYKKFENVRYPDNEEN